MSAGSVTVGIEDGRVALHNNATNWGARMEWWRAVEIGQYVQRVARGALGAGDRERFGPLAVRLDGEDVLIETVDGRLLFLWPAHAAVEVGNALIAKGRELEEQARAADLVFDQAVLQRAGIPLGLTNDRVLQHEAANEAAWGSRLRRYLPSSARLRQYIVGTPAVRKEHSHG